MPSTPIVVRYPLDPTGENLNNRVEAEEHTMPSRNVRAVAPYYGPFFAKSMVIREQATQRLLTKGVDYEIAYLYEIPSLKFGADICAMVLITNKNVLDTIELTYQVVGGEYSSSVDAIVQMINTLDIDDRPVKWEDIIGKPSEFDPAHHLHDIGDIYGFEYLVEACEGIRRAILMGDVATHDEIYRYIDAAVALITADVDLIRSRLDDHINNLNNPHQVTKGQVGLGNVNNYATAVTNAEVTGTATNLYMTPAGTKTVVDKLNTDTVQPHISNTNNPHQVTAQQVGTYTAAQIDALIAAAIAGSKVRVIDVANGTTLSDRATYANTWIRVTGINVGQTGALYIPPNVFQKDDVIMFNTLGGACAIQPAGGMSIRWPYVRNNVTPGPSGSSGIVFASPTVADMTGDTQLI